MAKDIIIAFLIGIILVLSEIFFVHPHKVHFAWQEIPGFYLLLGIVGGICIMFFAKFLGKVFLYRNDNYYKDN